MYVENYHYDQNLKTWLFDTPSPSCSASVTAGSISLMLLVAVAACKLYFFRKSEEPSRNVIMGIATIASVWVNH